VCVCARARAREREIDSERETTREREEREREKRVPISCIPFQKGRAQGKEEIARSDLKMPLENGRAKE
jgi:hypothetical protein